MKLYSMTGNNIGKIIHFITIEHDHMCAERGTPYWVINIFSTTEIRFIWLSFSGTEEEFSSTHSCPHCNEK